MPHVINVLVIISVICLGGYFWLLYEKQTTSSLISVGAIGYRLAVMVNYWFMIRLIRVQVQIMSEKEYTKIIMKKMRQSKVFEWIMLTLLSVNSGSVFLYFLPKTLKIQSVGKVLYSIFYGPTQIVFVTIFYFQMSKVNEQFHRLFKQIDDKSYPFKSVKATLLVLYFSTLVQCTLKVPLYFYDSIKLLYTAVLTVTLLCEGWFFVMFPLFMLYLADVNYGINRQNTVSKRLNLNIQDESIKSNTSSLYDASVRLTQDSALQEQKGVDLENPDDNDHLLEK